LTPDEVARYLFRSVVAWGRSSNVFLENGGRLYLDVGSHPEFATPECDSIMDVVLYDRAGDAILNNLVRNAENRLHDEGIRGTIYLFKNNTDSAGNSYGCHENFLVHRSAEPEDYQSTFIPFLVSRQIYAGAGKILSTPKGPVFALSQRAEHIWEDVSSATTRSRPIINTRDEPHADAEEYRRLHVIVGDSNMSEFATFLKVGTAACVLRMLEERPEIFKDLTLENPIRAIREISSDISCRRPIRLKNSKEMSALDIQRYFLDHAIDFQESHGFDHFESLALQEWIRVMEALETDPSVLGDRIDWVIKHQLLDRYCARHNVSLDSMQAHAVDLQYHDIDPTRGVFHKLTGGGHVRQLLEESAINHAAEFAPTTTRAHLRGDFIRQAKAKSRDFTVDWVHLKLNEQVQRTVVCKDPFLNADERVARLLDSM
jgi:proteasome accessory factor A